LLRLLSLFDLIVIGLTRPN